MTFTEKNQQASILNSVELGKWYLYIRDNLILYVIIICIDKRDVVLKQ